MTSALKSSAVMPTSAQSSSFGLRASQPMAGRTERLQREQMAGFERMPVVPPPVRAPPLQQQQQRSAPPPRQPQGPAPQPRQPNSQQAKVTVNTPPTAAHQTPAPAATAATASALESLTQVLVKRISEEIKPLRSALDAVTLRSSALENETKSLKSSLTSLRDEISGISQATGGASAAQKATEIGDSLRALQKAFGEFSAKKDNEGIEQDRKINAAQSLAETLAQEAYERSISVVGTVVGEDGVLMTSTTNPHHSIPLLRDSQILLHYPMRKKVQDDHVTVTMLHTRVAPSGDVDEYEVPIQVDGQRTVVFCAAQEDSVV